MAESGPAPDPSEPPDALSEVARGAGIAFLGRFGAVLEAVGFFLFAALYGPVAFGLFETLAAYARNMHEVAKLGMHNALQRFVPRESTLAGKHIVVRRAILVAVSIGVCIALLMNVMADILQGYINVDDETRQVLTRIVKIYAWAVPLWAFMEVSMAAIRALKVFGPDIRVRIFYENGLRVVAGLLFFSLGWLEYGLMLAHLSSLLAACLIASRLLLKHYSFRMFLSPDGPADVSFGEMMRFALAIAPSNIGKDLQSNLPIMILNAFIPGASGAVAAGVYSVSRRIVSSLQAFRMSISYVMAPIATELNQHATPGPLKEASRFATRLLWAFFVPVAGALLVFDENILSLLPPAYMAGTSVIVGLVIGRAFEAGTGPSSTIIEMIGRYRLLILNAFVGLTVTGSLLAWLVPLYELPGAAAAAAGGLATVHLMALVQVIWLYKVPPYDLQVLRTVLVSVGLTAVFAALTLAAGEVSVVVKISVGIPLMFITMALIVRTGLSPDDLVVIDPKGRFKWLWRGRHTGASSS